MKSTFLSKIKNTSLLIKISMSYLFYIYLAIFLFHTFITLLEIDLIERIKSNDNKDLSIWKYFLRFLQTVILVPILEEFSFRSYINLKRKSILYSISFLVVFIILAFLNEILILGYFLSLLLSFYLTLLFLRENLLNSKYIFKILWLFSAFIFALVHLNGMEYSDKSLVLVLLSIMPFFILGIGLGHARLKYGLIFSILIHMMFNLVGFLISLI